MLDRLIGMLRGKKARRRKDAERDRLFASQREQAAFRKLNVVAPLAGDVDKANAKGFVEEV